MSIVSLCFTRFGHRYEHRPQLQFSAYAEGFQIMMTDITPRIMTDGSPSTLMDTNCRTLIIGCGLGGLAAAIAIRKVGHEVTILEKRAQLQEVGL